MTFEEFFRKKRIDLVALQAAEPALFSEFKSHFDQMGEKSFDHTKKYWFNKLRLLYHLAAEQKPEKVHIENRLAEQTITESILEEKMPAPSVGFKPRFKPGMGSKPAEASSNVKDPEPKDNATATPEVNDAAATGDQNPPFEQDKKAMQAIADSTPRTSDDKAAEKPDNAPAAKPAGFKPRFNLKMTKGDGPQTKDFVPEDAEVKEPKAEEQDKPAPKPAGFTPRFKAGVTKPATEAAKAEEAESEKPKAESLGETSPKPAGFTPRFKAGVTKLKPPVAEEPKVDGTPPIETQAPTAETGQEASDGETAPPKPVGFKPRFNMKMAKPKPPEEE